MEELKVYFFNSLDYKKHAIKLISQLYQQHKKTLVLCKSQAQMLEYDNSIWSHKQLSFIPHATYLDPYQGKHPVLLSTRTTDIMPYHEYIVSIIAEDGLDDAPKFEITTQKFSHMLLLVSVSDSASNEFENIIVNHSALSSYKSITVNKLVTITFLDKNSAMWIQKEVQI